MPKSTDRLYARANPSSSEQTADVNNYSNGPFKDKPCKKCGEVFTPKAPSHLYCGDNCSSWAQEDRVLRRNYGIGRDEFTDMLEAQDHKCAICGSPAPESKGFKHPARLVIDHCHSSGDVRGLLCTPCNVGLGNYRDDPALLERAADYLRKG